MKSQALHVSQNEVACRLKPFTGRAHGNVGHIIIDGEIKHVTCSSWMPLKKRYQNSSLRKCKNSQTGHCLSSVPRAMKLEVWCINGKPTSGSIYETKCAMRREVRKRIKFCAAMKERKQIQERKPI